MLAAWFVCLTALALAEVTTDAIAQARWSFYSNRIGASVAVMLSIVPLIQFAYHFLHNSYPREARLLLFLSGCACLGLSAVFIVQSIQVTDFAYSFASFHWETGEAFPTQRRTLQPAGSLRLSLDRDRPVTQDDSLLLVRRPTPDVSASQACSGVAGTRADRMHQTDQAARPRCARRACLRRRSSLGSVGAVV